MHCFILQFHVYAQPADITWDAYEQNEIIRFKWCENHINEVDWISLLAALRTILDSFQLIIQLPLLQNIQISPDTY